MKIIIEKGSKRYEVMPFKGNDCSERCAYAKKDLDDEICTLKCYLPKWYLALEDEIRENGAWLREIKEEKKGGAK